MKKFKKWLSAWNGNNSVHADEENNLSAGKAEDSDRADEEKNLCDWSDKHLEAKKKQLRSKLSRHQSFLMQEKYLPDLKQPFKQPLTDKLSDEEVTNIEKSLSEMKNEEEKRLQKLKEKHKDFYDETFQSKYSILELVMMKFKLQGQSQNLSGGEQREFEEKIKLIDYHIDMETGGAKAVHDGKAAGPKDEHWNNFHEKKEIPQPEQGTYRRPKPVDHSSESHSNRALGSVEVISIVFGTLFGIFILILILKHWERLCQAFGFGRDSRSPVRAEQNNARVQIMQQNNRGPVRAGQNNARAQRMQQNKRKINQKKKEGKAEDNHHFFYQDFIPPQNLKMRKVIEKQKRNGKIVREPFARPEFYTRCGEFLEDPPVLQAGVYEIKMTVGLEESIHNVKLDVNQAGEILPDGKIEKIEGLSGLWFRPTGKVSLGFMLNGSPVQCRGEIKNETVRGRCKNGKRLGTFQLLPVDCDSDNEDDSSDGLKELSVPDFRFRFTQEFNGKVFEPGSEDNECLLCCDKFIDCALTPCGHLCVCSNCGIKLETCPLCRESITQVIIPE